MPLWEYVKQPLEVIFQNCEHKVYGSNLFKEIEMYHDEIFETALRDVREESYKALKEEISSMEYAIERFLKNVLECTSSKSERDFNVSTF